MQDTITVELTKEEILSIINNINYANSYYPDDDSDNGRDERIINKLNKAIDEQVIEICNEVDTNGGTNLMH